MLIRLPRLHGRNLRATSAKSVEDPSSLPHLHRSDGRDRIKAWHLFLHIVSAQFDSPLRRDRLIIRSVFAQDGVNLIVVCWGKRVSPAHPRLLQPFKHVASRGLTQRSRPNREASMFMQHDNGSNRMLPGFLGSYPGPWHP